MCGSAADDDIPNNAHVTVTETQPQACKMAAASSHLCPCLCVRASLAWGIISRTQSCHELHEMEWLMNIQTQQSSKLQSVHSLLETKIKSFHRVHCKCWCHFGYRWAPSVQRSLQSAASCWVLFYLLYALAEARGEYHRAGVCAEGLITLPSAWHAEAASHICRNLSISLPYVPKPHPCFFLLQKRWIFNGASCEDKCLTFVRFPAERAACIKPAQEAPAQPTAPVQPTACYLCSDK